MKLKVLFLVAILFTNYAMAQAVDDRFKLLQSTNGSYPYNTGIIKSQTYGLTNLNNAIVFNDFAFNYGDFNLFSGQGMKISSTGAHSPLTPIVYYTEYLNCALPSCFEGIWSLSSSPNEKFIYYNYFLASYSGNVTVILSYINSASVEHTVFFDLKAAGYDQVVSLSVNDAGTAVALTQTFLPGGERRFDVITLQPSGIITKLTPVAGHVDYSCFLSINNLGTIFLTSRDESSRFLQVFPQNSPARILSSNLYLFGGERIVGTDKTSALHPEGMVYIVKPYDGIYDSENNTVFTSYQFNQKYGKAVVMYEAKINDKEEFIWTGTDFNTGKYGLYLGWGQDPVAQTGDEIFHTPVGYIYDVHLNDNGVYVFTDTNSATQTSRLLMGNAPANFRLRLRKTVTAIGQGPVVDENSFSIAPSTVTNRPCTVRNSVSQVEIRVECQRVDGDLITNIEGCMVKPELLAGENTGGHSLILHNHGARPLGSFGATSGDSPTAIPLNGYVFRYTASDVAGDVEVQFQTEGPDGTEVEAASTFIHVRVDGLQAMDGIVGLSFVHTGHRDLAGLEGGRFGTSEMELNLNDAITEYRRVSIARGIPEMEVVQLRSEAASLMWGGLYDVHFNWSRPHCGHRVGKAIDLSMSVFNVNGSLRKNRMRTILQSQLERNFEMVVRDERPIDADASHWHVQLLRQN